MVVFESVPERTKPTPGTRGQLKSEAEVVVIPEYGFFDVLQVCGRRRLEGAVGRKGNGGMDVFLDRGLSLYRLLGLAVLVICHAAQSPPSVADAWMHTALLDEWKLV